MAEATAKQKQSVSVINIDDSDDDHSSSSGNGTGNGKISTRVSVGGDNADSNKSKKPAVILPVGFLDPLPKKDVIMKNVNGNGDCGASTDVSSISVGVKRKRIPASRQIHYRAAEVLPEPGGEKPQLIDHTLLQFAEGTEELSRFEKFVTREPLQPKTIDWELLEQLGQRKRLEDLLDQKWRDVLACSSPQYNELTLEFHSTFRHTPGHFEQSAAVSFSLGREVFEMSIPEFAVVTGFYTNAEVASPTFQTSLRGVFKKPCSEGVTEAQLSKFWKTIADGSYSSSAYESSIRDPFIKYLHRILASTLIGRQNGAKKYSHLDVFCLYCILGQREANLATIMVSSFARTRRGGMSARLDMGPYIGRIAERLGVFSRYPRDTLTLGPDVMGFGLLETRQAGICSLDEPPRWVPVRQVAQVTPRVRTPAFESLQRRAPSARRRALDRLKWPRVQHPVREPREVPDTMEARIMHRIDMMLERMDRHDRAIRDMMAFHQMPIPGYFKDPPEPETHAD